MRKSSGVCEEAVIDVKHFVLHEATRMQAVPFLQDVSACLSLHTAHFLIDNSYVSEALSTKCASQMRVSCFCKGSMQAIVMTHRHDVLTNL